MKKPSDSLLAAINQSMSQGNLKSATDRFDTVDGLDESDWRHMNQIGDIFKQQEQD